jgi:hypothetical protein
LFGLGNFNCLIEQDFENQASPLNYFLHLNFLCEILFEMEAPGILQVIPLNWAFFILTIIFHHFNFINNAERFTLFKLTHHKKNSLLLFYAFSLQNFPFLFYFLVFFLNIKVYVSKWSHALEPLFFFGEKILRPKAKKYFSEFTFEFLFLISFWVQEKFKKWKIFSVFEGNFTSLFRMPQKMEKLKCYWWNLWCFLMYRIFFWIDCSLDVRWKVIKLDENFQSTPKKSPINNTRK